MLKIWGSKDLSVKLQIAKTQRDKKDVRKNSTRGNSELWHEIQ